MLLSLTLSKSANMNRYMYSLVRYLLKGVFKNIVIVFKFRIVCVCVCVCLCHNSCMKTGYVQRLSLM